MTPEERADLISYRMEKAARTQMVPSSPMSILQPRPAAANGTALRSASSNLF